jgi:GTPase SAR1 family protein
MCTISITAADTSCSRVRPPSPSGDDAIPHTSVNIGRSIYKDADCLVLVYDITSRESFAALDTFWDSYIAYAQPFEPDEFPALLVGNKCDLNDRRAVPLEEVMDWCAAKRPRYE